MDSQGGRFQAEKFQIETDFARRYLYIFGIFFTWVRKICGIILIDFGLDLLLSSGIHPKNEKIGGDYFSAQKKLAEKVRKS